MGISVFTRRQFGQTLNTMFFALLLASLACTAHSSAPNPLVLEADVVVVGAGYAGLTSARHLTAKGMKVIVLEASNTSGGRTKNWDLAPGISAPDRVSPHVVELGGQWIGNKTVQKDAWELIVEELGFEVVCPQPALARHHGSLVTRAMPCSLVCTSPYAAVLETRVLLAR